MKVTNPHFRMEFPASFRGHKHRSYYGPIFVSFPEIGEIELPNVKRVEIGGNGGGWEITLTFLASAEVVYKDEDE
jgi:hypothetical protein